MYGDALIRSELHIEPDTLSDDEWAVQIMMAKWCIYNKAKEMGRGVASEVAKLLR